MFFFRRSQDKTGVQKINTKDYHERFFQGKEAHTLVDVRTKGEFKQGHLPGAINIPLDQLPNKLKKIPTSKPVVVVCASGNRSSSGARIIAQGGYEDVYNLLGGTMRWKMSGFPVK